MIAIAATVAAALAAGMVAERRAGEPAQRLARLVMSLMLYVLVPFVAFVNLAKLHITADLGVGILLAYVALAVTGTAAWLAGSRILRAPRATTGAMIATTIQANTGYFGFPLTVALLGSGKLGQAVIYDALITNPTLFIAGFAVGAGFGDAAGATPRERVRSFLVRNPPLFAALAGLLAPDAVAQPFLIDASHAVTAAMLALGFFAVGVTLQTEAEDRVVSFPPPLRAPAAISIGLRLVVMPALLLALSAPLIDLPGPYLLLAAAPTGLNSLVVAHAYGLDLRTTATAIVWSTAAVLAVGLVVAGVT